MSKVGKNERIREDIFTRSELMETLERLGMWGWDQPYWNSVYRCRKTFEPTYIKCEFKDTLGRLYGVRQWPQ